MIPKTDVVLVVVVIMIILIQYIITNYNSSKGKSPVSLVTFWESRRVPSLFLLISLFSLGFLCLLVFLPVIPIVDEQGAAEILLGLLSSFVSFCFPWLSAMQEEALKLVLLALEDGSALSRKVLVLFVVQRLEPRFPQASKTSIGHVVQLLYRASCFKVRWWFWFCNAVKTIGFLFSFSLFCSIKCD